MIFFSVKEGWKKFFFSKKPKFHPKKKDEWQFSIFWGKLQQNSRPFSYFNFKNWYIKLVSELMSMLNYTEIVENAALWSRVVFLSISKQLLYSIYKVPYLYYFLPQIFKYSAVPVTFITIHSTFVLGKPVLHTIYYMVL